MIALKKIIISCAGKRVDYEYESKGRAKQFTEGAERLYIEYPMDVSACPLSILAIPFVANFEPLGWFAGFDVHVPELDEQFMKCRASHRLCFSRMYPARRFANSAKADRLVRNEITGGESLMLYSGGLDAATTLARNYDKSITLVLVRGADVDVADVEQWKQLNNHVYSQEITRGRPILTVTSNLRRFYNPYVESRLLVGWWGRVQHGGALLGILAPLDYLVGATTNIISSSYNIPMAWGSTKDADESIRWAGVSCKHDAAEMSRQSKASFLVGWSRSTGIGAKLRVCYSEVRRDGNCGRCEKCYRTILNLVLSGADPRDYGLPFATDTYEKLLKLMLKKESSPGLIKFWGEIRHAAQAALREGGFFVLSDPVAEGNFIRLIANGEVDRALRANHSMVKNALSRLKFHIRIEYPTLFSLLRKVHKILTRSPN